VPREPAAGHEQTASREPAPIGRPRGGNRPIPLTPRNGPPLDASELPPLEGSSTLADRAPRPLTLPTPQQSASQPSAPEQQASLPPRSPPAQGAAVEPERASPPPRMSASLASTGEYRDCRPYTSSTSVTGRDQPVEGWACRLPDGRWRLLTESPRR
jgi:hypothetical protein